MNEVVTREKYWGEILERTLSSQNLIQVSLSLQFKTAQGVSVAQGGQLSSLVAHWLLVPGTADQILVGIF